MSKALYKIPKAYNEPVLDYRSGSPEKLALKAELENMQSEEIEVFMRIGDQDVRGTTKMEIVQPHDHSKKLGHFYLGGEEHVYQAIDAALAARKQWQSLSWHYRASIFLKAADLVAGKYRQKLNASTMLAQSKSVYQAEIDANSRSSNGKRRTSVPGPPRDRLGTILAKSTN